MSENTKTEKSKVSFEVRVFGAVWRTDHAENAKLFTEGIRRTIGISESIETFLVVESTCTIVKKTKLSESDMEKAVKLPEPDAQRQQAEDAEDAAFLDRVIDGMPLSAPEITIPRQLFEELTSAAIELEENLENICQQPNFGTLKQLSAIVEAAVKIRDATPAR